MPFSDILRSRHLLVAENYLLTFSQGLYIFSLLTSLKSLQLALL